jgi:hypothetical protein
MNATARSNIIYTTERRGLSGQRMSDREAAEQREIMAVALAQPHRRDAEYPNDERLEGPLGRFVAKIWDRKDELYSACFRAGCDYRKDVNSARVAHGFVVEGFEPAKLGLPISLDYPTPAQIAAQQAVIAELDRVVARANETLVEVHYRLPRAMERLCCTLLDPSPYDEDMLRAGLWRLAGHYGLLDRGINSLRPY